VRAGDIPEEEVHDLGIISSVGLDPAVTKADDLDHEALFDDPSARDGEGEIREAMRHEPSIAWLLENQDKVEHLFHHQGLEGNP
jgi:5,6,7,8-tetrahydromethanopterin hydro-lyase